MPRYEYRCPECGIVEMFHAIGTAPSEEECPSCGDVARRRFSPPLLRRNPQRLASALDEAEKSRHEPEVVRRDRQVPRADPSPAVDPALRKLVGKQAARDLTVTRHPAMPR